VLVKQLTDTETPFARKYGALPTERTAVYTAMSPMNETTRLELWKLGSLVIDDAKVLISWINNMTSCMDRKENKKDNINNSNNKNNQDEDDAETSEAFTRQLSHNSEKLLLIELKQELEALEAQKTSAGDEFDTEKRKLQNQATEKNVLLTTSVENRIEKLTKFENEYNLLMEICKTEYCEMPNKKKNTVGPHNGKDAALSIAWLISNKSRLLENKEKIQEKEKVLLCTKSYLIENELVFLKRMALAAKVVAHVTSPIHKKLLNLSYNWLRFIFLNFFICIIFNYNIVTISIIINFFYFLFFYIYNFFSYIKYTVY
jgi:hypothetical protein